MAHLRKISGLNDKVIIRFRICINSVRDRRHFHVFRVSESVTKVSINSSLSRKFASKRDTDNVEEEGIDILKKMLQSNRTVVEPRTLKCSTNYVCNYLFIF